jgi:hypothetical protein
MSSLALSTAVSGNGIPMPTLDDPFSLLNSPAAAEALKSHLKPAADPFRAAHTLGSANGLLADGSLAPFLKEAAPLALAGWREHALQARTRETLADPVGSGLNALEGGEEAMRDWTRIRLGMGGEAMPFEVKLFEDSGFTRGLSQRWDALTADMQKLSPEVRGRYEGILNQEMDRATQLALLHDEAVGEYAPMQLRSYSASGEGALQQREITAATRAEVAAGDAAQATLPGIATNALSHNGSDAMRQAFAGLDSIDQHARQQLDAPGIALRIHMPAIAAYQGAKFTAAVDYASQFAEQARGGIVALAMGKDYARMWLASELGFEQGKAFQGKTDDQALPNTRALTERWGVLSRETLMAMPEHLRKKYEPLANDTLHQGLATTLVMDKQIGKYDKVVVRDFDAQRGETATRFRYSLDDNDRLLREVVQESSGKKGNCIKNTLLPIAAVVLSVIPVTAPIGAALSAGLAVKNGIETGNWLGAVAGVATGMAGLGGMAGMATATTNTLNTVASVARVAAGAQGLYEGIKHGDPLAAISGGMGVAGGLSRLSVDGGSLQMADASHAPIVSQAVAGATNVVGQAAGMVEGLHHGNFGAALQGGIGVMGGLSGLSYSAEGGLHVADDQHAPIVSPAAAAAARIAGNVVGTVQAIEHHNTAAALNGGISVLGGLSQLSYSAEEGLQLANRQRPGIVPQGLAATASLIGSAYTVHQGLQGDNPLQVAAGLTGAAGAFGRLAGWQENAVPSLSVQLAGRAVSMVGSAMRQDQVGAALAATQGAQLWNLIRAIDISPQLTQLGGGGPVSVAPEALEHLAEAQALRQRANTIGQIQQTAQALAPYIRP